MFTKFKRTTKVLFLDPKSTEPLVLEKGKKVSIILSPSLYWVKKLELPINSVREVRKLIPSLFENLLPEGHYSYSVYKKDAEFILFAYEDKKILNELASKGINAGDIASLHFAQSEFASLESAVSINTLQSMCVKNGLVVIAPSAWVQEQEPLELSEKQLSKHTLKLQQYGHIVDNKSLYKIGIILSFLVFILAAELFIATSKRDAIVASKDGLFEKYKLQSTTIQNNSSMKKYSKIHTSQTKLREYMNIFLSIKLKASQKITLIDYKNKTLFVTINGVKKENSRVIISKLDSKKLKYKTSFNGENMKVELKL